MIPLNPVVLVLTLAFLLAQASAQSQNAIDIQTKHLKIQFMPASGELKLDIHGAASDTVFYSTKSPGLYVDDVRQADFQMIPRQSPAVFQNDRTQVEFEILGERAVAVNWTARDHSIHDFDFHLRSDDPTAYYGTGERYNALNQRGYSLPLATDDRFGNKGVGSHKPIPFFMSSRGFGVWVDSYAPGVFDLNATERFVTMLRFPENRLRIVFIAGPELAEILNVFTQLTGRSPVPPEWAFGLWKSRDVHHNQDSVLTDIENLRKYKIPASVLVLDSPWETGYNDFEVNRRQFTGADGMFRRIEELGFRLCLWLTPFVNKRNVIDMEGIAEETATFSEAAERGFLVTDSSGEVALSEWWKGAGGLVDFTNPEAVEWWHQQLLKTKAYGARAFKCDDGEGNFVPQAVFHDGTPAMMMKNRYSVIYDSVMQQYVEQHLGGDGVLIVRSGYTGCQKYPFAWAGDNQTNFSFSDGLPSVILAGQNAALSGISLWGSDIAGYVGKPSKELFIRWSQFAVFCPFMQIHMTSNLGPWDFDEETLRIFRDYAVLRVQLFPYLYNAAHEAARSGLSVIRPMVLAFPNDAEAHRHIYQYLFGPDILVAPVYQPGTYRSVYLPQGDWTDYWSGEHFRGPQIIEVHAPLDKIPLFIRPGAIIPMLPGDVQTLVPRHSGMSDEIIAIDERRILEVWQGDSGALETWDGIAARISHSGDEYRLELDCQQTMPLEVHLKYSQAENLQAENAELRYHESEKTTILKFRKIRTKQTITWKENVQ